MAKPAARKSDPYSCPVPGHGTNPIAVGSSDVMAYPQRARAMLALAVARFHQDYLLPFSSTARMPQPSTPAAPTAAS
jgi:hypothetical protein